MQVHGMSVIGSVSHHQPIARFWFQHKFAFVRIRFPIHEPQVEFPRASWDLFKNKFDGLLRQQVSSNSRFRKSCSPKAL